MRRTADPRPRIYVPESCPDQILYYEQLARDQPRIRLDVKRLTTEMITPEGIRDLNDKPGLLALAMESYTNKRTGATESRGLPFVVPGGRFNEMYGWDSYMESIGLIANGRGDLAKSMVQNFCFCIKHYGKIFNANRTYYLGRTQPPFLTDMALQVYETIRVCSLLKQLHQYRCRSLNFHNSSPFLAKFSRFVTWHMAQKLSESTVLTWTIM